MRLRSKCGALKRCRRGSLAKEAVRAHSSARVQKCMHWSSGYAQTCSVSSPGDSRWLTSGRVIELLQSEVSTLRDMVWMWITLHSLT